MFKTFIIFGLAVFLSGCTHSEGQYAVISNQPVELNNLMSSNYRVTSAKAISRRHIVMLIPFSKAPSAGDAITAVLKEYHGDYLANAEVKMVNNHFWPFYHYKAWEVSGTVMRLRHS